MKKGITLFETILYLTLSTVMITLALHSIFVYRKAAQQQSTTISSLISASIALNHIKKDIQSSQDIQLLELSKNQFIIVSCLNDIEWVYLPGKMVRICGKYRKSEKKWISRSTSTFLIGSYQMSFVIKEQRYLQCTLGSDQGPVFSTSIKMGSQ
jgi:hypothetical protein